jgi:hypothetical protein
MSELIDEELTDEERMILLVQSRNRLKATRLDMEALGFGYEVTDAIRELIDFIEFELDEMEWEYE